MSHLKHFVHYVVHMGIHAAGREIPRIVDDIGKEMNRIGEKLNETPQDRKLRELRKAQSEKARIDSEEQERELKDKIRKYPLTEEERNSLYRGNVKELQKLFYTKRLEQERPERENLIKEIKEYNYSGCDPYNQCTDYLACPIRQFSGYSSTSCYTLLNLEELKEKLQNDRDAANLREVERREEALAAVYAAKEKKRREIQEILNFLGGTIFTLIITITVVCAIMGTSSFVKFMFQSITAPTQNENGVVNKN
jgi:hypothetical protein